MATLQTAAATLNIPTQTPAMARSSMPKTASASTCTPDTASGTHVFRINGYSLHKGLGIGKYVSSETFVVGGYDWCIRYYPDGDNGDGCRDYVSTYLELLTKDAEVRASFDIKLVHPVAGVPSFQLCHPIIFKNKDKPWGFQTFKKTSELEASPYLRDDCLVIECMVTVTKKPRVSGTSIEVQVPPSDLLAKLAKLLDVKKGADVTLKVQGEVFHAHKIVLALQSPVFDAEFFGPMGDKGKQYITIQEMQPVVFKALLEFIYTDSLPSMDDLDDSDRQEMVKHLLVAADRYAMDRMRVMCESILCRHLDVKNVASTLALADQHNCLKLKDACFEYILSSNRTDEVVATQGYVNLKRSFPALIIEVFERMTKPRKT